MALRKPVQPAQPAAPPIVAGAVPLDQLATAMGYANPGVARTRAERDGVPIVSDWRGRPAVTAEHAGRILAEFKAEQEELSAQNEAYTRYIEAKQQEVIEKQLEAARKAKAEHDAAKARARDADEQEKAAKAQRHREEQIAAQGAPVSFDAFLKGAR